jgi:FMN-dependent oxidoreductase (nitrilotriacetate monooxygenase family)
MPKSDKTKMIHFAWFGCAGAHAWNTQAGSLYDWRRGDLYMEVARIAERAFMDMVLVADKAAVPTAYGGNNDFYVRNGFDIHMDPTPILAMMGAVTKHIGLGATLSTSAYPPFLLARQIATLDQLSAGRTAWNVVTSVSNAVAQNYGQDTLPPHDERYDIADEYIDVVRKLWASWDRDALIQDRESNVFADPSKVKPINFSGKYYKSRGPLNVPATPQGQPVIVQAGTSNRGQEFSAANADMVIAHKNTLADMKSYVAQFRGALEKAGRDPASCKIFFAIKPVMGDTEQTAKEVWQRNYEKSSVEAGLSYLSDTLNIDLSKFDLDKPLPPDLPVTGMIGKLLQHTQSNKHMTLREIARHEGMSETYPICGTPEQCADIIERTAKESGADGFHFRPAGPGGTVGDIYYLTEVASKLMPILQRRGLARTSYSGSTLKENLFAF